MAISSSVISSRIFDSSSFGLGLVVDSVDVVDSVEVVVVSVVVVMVVLVLVLVVVVVFGGSIILVVTY